MRMLSPRTPEKRKNIHGPFDLKSFNPIILNHGFTLIELLVAAAIGMITIMVAGRVMVDQMRISKDIETKERQRNEWIRANRFITNEINLAAKIETTASISEANACSIGAGTIKMVVHFPRHLQLSPSIYYTANSQPGWRDNLLKRCGPSIAEDGDYDGSILSEDILLDELDKRRSDEGFYVQVTGDKKAAFFQITLAGKINNKISELEGPYSSVKEGARARVQDVFLRPNETNICPETSAVNLSTGDDLFTKGNYPNWSKLTQGNILVCGNGGDDTIQAADGNDIIEASSPGRNSLTGGDGNDRIVGADQNDELFGGNGDDILIGKQGNDILNGGSGTNHYVPGIDDETSRCDRDEVRGTADNGYDIIYFDQQFDRYSLSDQCDNNTCRVKRKSSGDRKVVDIFGGDLLVFDDQHKELGSGTSSNLSTLSPAPCNLQLATPSTGGGTTGGGGTTRDKPGGGNKDGGNKDGGDPTGGSDTTEEKKDDTGTTGDNETKDETSDLTDQEKKDKEKNDKKR